MRESSGSQAIHPHRWLVAVTDEVLAAVRDRLGFEEPTADEIDRMADRI